MAFRRAFSALSSLSLPSSSISLRSSGNPTLRIVSAFRNFSVQVASTSQPSTTQSEVDSSNSLSTADYSFIARTGLQFSRPETYLQAVTHKSYKHGKTAYNDRLEYLGYKVVGLYAAEYVHSKYPNLPSDALRDAVNAYTCHHTLMGLGRALGVHSVMRWHPRDDDNSGENTIIAKTTLALIGALYHEKGSIAARHFVHAGLLSREIDMEALIKLDEPKRLLSALLKRKGMEAPISRLLNETGRHSSTPAFVVGVFSGVKKLGAGYGSSIKMAEHRAAKSALIEYFLRNIGEPLLPSEADTLPEEAQLTFFGSPLGDSPPII